VPIYALGDTAPTIDPTAYVHPDAVVIGDVRIGPESSVWPNAVLRGDNGHIEIGARTSIQDGTVIHCTPTEPTIIGDQCTIGHLAHLEGCVVGNLSLIGSGSVVLNGARIGDEALVAAGALVGPGKEVPSRHRALGVPAQVSPLGEHIHERQSDSYVAKALRYRAELRLLE
jgi:carbonic anhydrase/acetyltransferase-like protein (isoleucine patch superfamily)